MVSNTILIFGTKGFLGSHVQSALKNNDKAVSEKVKIISCDRSLLPLECTQKLITFLDETQPKTIINCAAKVSFDPKTPHDFFYTVNVLVPALLSDWCHKNNAFYIHISTTAVHGIGCEHIDENTPYLPDSPYGYSKYLAELNILCSKANSAIIRFGGIWGGNGPEHLGINKALMDALSGRSLTFSGTGGKRNYIHVKCAANVIEHIAKNQLSGIFFAAPSQAITIQDMVCALSRKFSLPPALKTGDAQINDSIISVSPGIKDLILNFEEALNAYV